MAMGSVGTSSDSLRKHWAFIRFCGANLWSIHQHCRQPDFVADNRNMLARNLCLLCRNCHQQVSAECHIPDEHVIVGFMHRGNDE